jgi:hypothetical protein
MSDDRLVMQWDDHKSDPALQELVSRGHIKVEELPDVKAGKIWVGMSKAAMYCSRGVTSPEYSDADGAKVYRYGGTYVKVVDFKVVDWWYLR